MMETLGRTLHEAAPALLVLLVRGAVVLATAAVAVRLLRGASASARHLVWASALWALLLLPVASVVLPAIALPILPPLTAGSVTEKAPAEPAASIGVPAGADAPPMRAAPVEAVALAPVPVHTAGPLPSPGSPAATSAPDPPVWSWRAMAMGVWAIVALVMLAEVARSRLRLRRLSAAAWRIHDPAWWRAAARIGAALGLRRPVTLLATARTPVPLTWGTRNPIVLLPAEANCWPAERREAVLVHELAHVARGDALGHDIGRLAAALFWVNPLVWFALRGMRAERERACDDLVLATGTRPSSYAGDLLAIARMVAGRSPAAAAALAMARPTELEGRLLAILDPRVPRRPVSRAGRTAAAALAITMVVPLGALRPAQRVEGPPHARQAGGEPVASLAPASRPRASSPGESFPQALAGDAGDSAWVKIPAVGTVPELSTVITGESRPAADLTIVAPAPTTQAVVFATDSAKPSPSAPATGRSDDLETLIAVANAAAGMSSANEKAELLLAVLARNVRNDSLQRVVLRAASTIESGYDRHRVMLAMVRAGLAGGTGAMFLRVAGGISGAHERGMVLTAFARTDGLTDGAIRAEFLKAVATLTSDYSRAQLLGLVIRLPSFDPAAALDVLPAIGTIGSSYEQANLLVAMAQRGVTADAAVREAYLSAAASIRSTYDRGRAVAAAEPAIR